MVFASIQLPSPHSTRIQDGDFVANVILCFYNLNCLIYYYNICEQIKGHLFDAIFPPRAGRLSSYHWPVVGRLLCAFIPFCINMYIYNIFRFYSSPLASPADFGCSLDMVLSSFCIHFVTNKIMNEILYKWCCVIRLLLLLWDIIIIMIWKTISMVNWLYNIVCVCATQKDYNHDSIKA